MSEGKLIRRIRNLMIFARIADTPNRNCLALAYPIPAVPPVTNATFPFNSIISIFGDGHLGSKPTLNTHVFQSFAFGHIGANLLKAGRFDVPSIFIRQLDRFSTGVVSDHVNYQITPAVLYD